MKNEALLKLNNDISKLIVKSSEDLKLLNKDKSDKNEIEQVKTDIKKITEIQQQSNLANLPPEVNAVYKQSISQLESIIENMGFSRYKDYNFEKKREYNEKNSKSYIELIQNFSDNGHKGFYDVFLELEFSRKESVQSIKDIVSDMQSSDIDVNIISNDNNKFLIAMPCTAYKAFNGALNMFVISEEPIDQLNNIKEFMCLPSLNKITTLEELKSIASDFKNDNDIEHIEESLRKNFCSGTTSLINENNGVLMTTKDIFKNLLTGNTDNITIANKIYIDSEHMQELGIAHQRISLLGESKINISKQEKQNIENLLNAKSDKQSQQKKSQFKHN